MKTFALLLLTVSGSSASGQQGIPLPLDPKTHRLTYAADVPLAGVDQLELLTRATYWASQREQWERPTSQLSDTHQVLVKGCTPLTYRVAGQLTTIPLRFMLLYAAPIPCQRTLSI